MTLLDAAPDWPAHIALRGPLPALDPEQLIAAGVGIAGRGGGGFPLARKLTAAAEHGRGTVVGNCCEGEPAIGKDAALLAAAPHLVVDGLLLAARATRSRRVVMAVHQGCGARRVRQVLAERPDARAVEVLEVPESYVAGEASALVRQLSGGPPVPRQRATPLAVGRRPHLVQNAETLACLALAARGLPVTTTLVTVRGAVRSPGVYDALLGCTLADVVDRAGGLRGPAQAVLTGGWAGAWLPADVALRTPLDRGALREAGGSLGAGLVEVLGADECGVGRTATLSGWLGGQSAGRCGPCARGLPAIAEALHRLAGDGPAPTEVAQVLDWCDNVEGRGACALPDGAVAMVRSALRVFAEDLPAHATSGCGRAGR